MAKMKQFYKGFELKQQTDCWGDQSYFVYDKYGQQLFDAHDTKGDALEAIDEYLGARV